MIQKFTYTRFMLLYILLYRVTRSKFIGAVAFNTSLAVLLSFESLHIIDKHAVSLIKKECNHFPLCNLNKNIFYIYDFLIHGVPFIYFILSPSFIKQNPQTLLHSSVVSCGLHFIWGYIVTNGSYRLEFIYIPSSNYKLSKKSWKRLWLITAASHFVLPICKKN